MPLSLLPGEQTLHESDYTTKTGLFGSRSISIQIQVTDHRLVGTEVLKQFGSSFLGGGEFTRHVPLEMIDGIQEGKSSSPIWSLAAVTLLILGIVFTITVIGAIVGIPMIVLGAICLFIWLLSRREGVSIFVSGEEVIKVPMRGRGGAEALVEAVELARLKRVNSVATGQVA